jgi:hypothetical protein
LLFALIHIRDMDVIEMGEALQIVESGNPFSCVVVTYDESRKQGGDILKLENVCIPRSEKEDKSTPREFKPRENYRKQNHAENATRNVMLPNGLWRKIHIRLILSINGKRLYY